MGFIRHSSELSRTARCLGFTLLIGNCIFCLLGLTVIGIGIYLIVEKIQYVTWILGTQLMAASCYLIIAAGTVMFLMSLIGCFGTLFLNRTILLVYCFVLSIVFILATLGSVLAIVFSAWVSDIVRVFMLESLLDLYGYHMQDDWNNLITRSWDEAQWEWKCCGVDDERWSIYRQSNWYKDLPGVVEVDKPYVPASCCVKNSDGTYADLHTCQLSNDMPPGRPFGRKNEYIYYRGCFKAGSEALKNIAIYFIVIGFVFALLVIGAVVCSLMLYPHL